MVDPIKQNTSQPFHLPSKKELILYFRDRDHFTCLIEDTHLFEQEHIGKSGKKTIFPER